MKITHVTTQVLRTPADNPLVVGLPAPTDTREFVTLELGTDQGLVGVGLTFFGGALTVALKVAVDTLAGLVAGDDPTQTEAIAAKLMREAIGPDVDLICDINQLWSVNHAIEVGRRIEPYHLYWLEDPVAHDDYAGLARVADALTTPIAAGEYHYGTVPFRHLLEARSIDIVMIDLLRVGGITQWMKVAGMAEAFNLPVVS